MIVNMGSIDCGNTFSKVSFAKGHSRNVNPVVLDGILNLSLLSSDEEIFTDKLYIGFILLA